mmetsp:Transcript_54306/g.128589  ORF Transcript_54306/g.128589 Transcript_54306/m.128589 type:complete len:124 (-) Transcript_54306:73-444(-)
MEKMLSGVGDKVIELSRDKWYKLVFSILIDIIGIMTYLIPLLAELMDVFWAPLSALLIFQMYGSSLLTGVALIEELLPFTDIVPTATIGWLCQYTILGAWLGIDLSPKGPLRPNPRITEVRED